MALETLALEHLPASHKAHVAFFRGVENAAFLHQRLLNREAEFEYAFVDASVVRASTPFPSPRHRFTGRPRRLTLSGQILSRRQLLSSVFKSTLAAANGALRTPNVHSEIVIGLSASNNVRHVLPVGPRDRA